MTMRPRLRRGAARRLPALLLCAWVAAWLSAVSTAAAAKPQEKITLEFNDVDIRVVVKFISQLVHKNFIVDDAVKGKVTVISPVPVSPQEAYEIFLSILDVKGFAAVPAGRVVKIIPAAEARAKRLPTVTAPGKEPAPADDRVRTQLIQLEHIEASRVVPLIKPLIAKTSHVEAFDEANTILITDVASNIARIQKIIEVIDTPGFQQQLAIIRLKYATADKLAGQISSIFGGARSARPVPRAVRRGRTTTAGGGLAETEVKVFADDRTNSLIVFATKNDLKKVKELVEQLDVPPPENNARVRIYRLQHVVAEDLANVLSGVVSAQAKGGAPGVAGKAPSRPPQARAGAAARGVLGEEVSIIPDPANNALIVTASPEEQAAIEELIKKLDTEPLQVYVEALIVEVALDSNFNLGVEWRALAQKGSSGVVIGNVNTGGTLDSIAAAGAGSPPQLPTGLAIGFLGDTIEFNGVTLPSLGALVTALKGTSGANIISTPQILTLNNKEAEFDSVQTIPFQTGTSTGTGVNVVSTFDFRDVGTKLRITPHINEKGYVRLEIHQEVSNVVDSSVIGLPTTSKRSADTVAVVKDNHTIVIGGLISNQMTTSTSKVPLLGDIPLLGALFRSTHRGTTKTNLLVFITPHVIHKAETLSPFTEKRSRENPLLQGEEFKGMMRETFQHGFPGIGGGAPGAQPEGGAA
ncbi:MAG: type II secretion system protein GspD, partial [Nitrospirae bacterium]